MHNVNFAGHDLRRSEQQLEFLAARVRQARLEEPWREWETAFGMAATPGALLHCATRGQPAFRLIDAWRSTRHEELARFVVNAIIEHQLLGLQSPAAWTPQGAPVGEHYAQNRLLGGFSTPRAIPENPLIDICLALAFLAVVSDTRTAESNWVEVICGAAHNNGTPRWQSLIASCAPPDFPADYVSVLDWALAFSSQPLVTGRDIERRFRSAVTQTAKFLLAPNTQARIFRQRSGEPIRLRVLHDPVADDLDIDLEPVVRNREWVVTPNVESTEEADVPDVDLFVVPPQLPPDEPEPAAESTKSAGIRTAFRSAIDNQHLRYHWDVLLPTETSALIRACDSDFNSALPERAIPALIFGLAICLGKRPRGILEELTISDGTSPGLCLLSGHYIKEVPRPPHSWRMNPRRPCEVSLAADAVKLCLPDKLIQTARKMLNASPTSSTVCASIRHPRNVINAWLNDWLAKTREGTHRFSSRRIARILEVESYALTQRAVTTYWICGTAEDPPPSLAYYTTAPAADLCRLHHAVIESLWQQAGLDAALSPPDEPEGTIGSRLSPPDAAIRELVKHLASAATRTTEESGWDDIRRFHNRYVAYVVTLLMYASGHRPVDDPFDAFYTCSAKGDRALIEDKHLGDERSARLVALPAIAMEQLHAYRTHLTALLSALPPQSALARALADQLNNPASRVLPLFFFLTADGNWKSVTGAELLSYYPPDWPYPLNLHRHLLATWFYRERVDEEAIAQFMGHVDAGTAGLSASSPHSPASLLDPIAPIIENFLSHHQWRAIRGLTTVSGEKVQLPPDLQQATTDRKFGIEKRAAERKVLEANDRDQVEHLLKQQLAGRQESELSAEDARSLISAVARLASNQSTRRATFRMEILRERLTRISKTSRSKLPIPAIRRIASTEPSLFTERSLLKAEKAGCLRGNFLAHLDRIRAPLSAKSLPDRCSAYALFALISLGRVLDVKCVEGVLSGAPYWIIDDVDYGFVVEIQVSPNNIRRYPICPLSAALLNNSCFSHDREKHIQGELGRLISALTGGRDRDDHLSIQQLIALYREEAYLTLPGNLAAYVTGDSGAVSLPRHAYLRLRTGKLPLPEKLPRLQTERSDPSSDSGEMGTNNSSDSAPQMRLVTPIAEEASRSRKHAMTFVAEVDAIIARHWTPAVDDKGRTRAKNKTPLTPIVLDIKKLLRQREAAGTLMPISQILGEWLMALCTSGSVKGSVVATTIATYWSTVKGPITEHAHDISLPYLVSGGIEEVYSRILDETESLRPEIVLKRLKVFQWFLTQHFGAPVVDWTEVIPEDFPAERIAVDAGFITQDEYRTALDLLHQDPYIPDSRERTLHCMCLIFLYRFGLRISEATGIRLKDVIRDGDLLTLRVCNTDFRKIKTDAGIRCVPLLGDFSVQEAEIFRRWTEHIKHCHGDDKLAGVFALRDSARTLVSQWRLSSRVRDALIAVTGDDSVRLHHCRHSFISRTLSLLDAHDLCSQSRQEQARKNCAHDVETTLLARSEESRRTAWAVAAIAGHAHPRTSAKYYQHLNDFELARKTARDSTIFPTDNQLANALGIRRDDLRNVRRKSGNAARDVVRTVCQIESTDQLVSDRTTTNQIGPPQFTVERKSLESNDLITTLRVLQAADAEARLENIGNRTLCSPEHILAVLDAAASISHETEYSRHRRTSELPYPDADELSRVEWSRLFTAAHNVCARTGRETYNAAGKLWIDGFAPSLQEFLLCDEEHIGIVIELLRQAGVSLPNVQALLERDCRSENWAKTVFEKARSFGVEVAWADRLPRLPLAGRRRESGRRRFAIRVLENRTDLIRSRKAAHRLFFAAAISDRLSRSRL